jgi:hypothetical protein
MMHTALQTPWPAESSEELTDMLNWISDLWCRKMHTQAMWPIHGKYICPQCLREHRVAWEGIPRPAEYADPNLRSAGLPVTSIATALQ